VVNLASLTLLIIILITVILILIFLYLNAKKELEELRLIHDELRFEHKSHLVKHGKAWEDFVPFMPEFEKIANKDNFTFIGMPIDGIAFDDDAIKFIEVKTGESKLNAKQKRVKELIESKKVKWYELRF